MILLRPIKFMSLFDLILFNANLRSFSLKPNFDQLLLYFKLFESLKPDINFDIKFTNIYY